MGTLIDLCRRNQYDTDKYFSNKDKAHRYVEAWYDPAFESLRTSVTQVLEIGTRSGGSLKMWRDFFPNATITGIEYSLAVYGLPDSGPRINLIVGDAYSQSTLDIFQDEKFDIIIDDASHYYQDQLFCLKNYEKKLKPGGWMIIEDFPRAHGDPLVKNAPFPARVLEPVHPENEHWSSRLFVMKKG